MRNLVLVVLYLHSYLVILPPQLYIFVLIFIRMDIGYVGRDIRYFFLLLLHKFSSISYCLNIVTFLTWSYLSFSKLFIGRIIQNIMLFG